MAAERSVLSVDWAGHPGIPVQTERMILIPATAEMLEAESRDPARLATILGARIPEQWPPRHVPDPDSLAGSGWWNWYFVRRATDHEGPVLVGFGAMKGWPAVEGTVHVGCAVVDNHQGEGYGREGFWAMAEWAFSQSVERVVTEVPSGHGPSLESLAKLGFTSTGPGSDEGFTRYERRRV